MAREWEGTWCNPYYLLLSLRKRKKKKAAKEVKKTNKGKEEAIKHSHNKISQFTSLSAPFLQLFFTNFCGPEQRETQT